MIDYLEICKNMCACNNCNTESNKCKLFLEYQRLSTANGWIPCSERLPENKVNVLISKANKSVRVGFCNLNYNEWREDGYVISSPIAWQNLPEPYKGE